MKPIWQAVQRAKEAAAPAQSRPIGNLPRSGAVPAQPIPEVSPPAGKAGERETVELHRAHLRAARIVAHDATDPRSKAFDILRTQVLQTMDQETWQFVAVTSPRDSCGKTLTAINLALSIARQPERSVILVDLDLQKPTLSARLGFNSKYGVVSFLEGRSALRDCVIESRIGATRFLVLPCETRVIDSSELIGSRAMRTMLQTIKRDLPSHTVIIDTPPMLATDDVLALLPQLDCVLLVAAVGSSTVAEIKQCQGYLNTTPMIRLVLNKSAELADYTY